MYCNMPSAKWCPSWPGFKVLKWTQIYIDILSVRVDIMQSVSKVTKLWYFCTYLQIISVTWFVSKYMLFCMFQMLQDDGKIQCPSRSLVSKIPWLSTLVCHLVTHITSIKMGNIVKTDVIRDNLKTLAQRVVVCSTSTPTTLLILIGSGNTIKVGTP